MEKLREYRRRSGLSMEALGKKIGVSMHSIFRWEVGKSSPTAKELVQLAVALHVTPNELLGVNTGGGETH